MEPSVRGKSVFKSKSNHEGKIIGGKYRYLKVLGTGGMGEVHLVMDVETGQRLAVKCCFDESYAKRFEHEVHSWIKIGKHPNLVTAFYFDVLENLPALFIEYVEGFNLKQVITQSTEQKHDLPLEVVLDYGIQICRGMSHLHRIGVIHRDLKPSNILIANEPDGPGRIKITDMGISKIKGSVDIGISKIKGSVEPLFEKSHTLPIGDDLTHTHEMLGTPQYMSPQQYAYSKGVGEETDIYAFGLIMYEMLAQGKKPFHASDSQGWFYAHTYAAPQHVKSQVSSRFSIFGRKSRSQLYALVMQCLAKESQERPQTFVEIEDQLRGLYIKITGKEYARDQMIPVTDLSEDELNNQAVSLLEMGSSYTQEGWKKLEELCDSAPDCLEAQLNRLMFQLKHNQLSLQQFWAMGKKMLADEQLEKPKIVAVMGNCTLEKGSYYEQTQSLLRELGPEADCPPLLRLRAKWLYLSGRYEEAIPIWEELCQRQYHQGEDFYHHAGAIACASLQSQTAKLCLHKGRFSIEFDSPTKQKIWYILREGEDKCGASTWFERAKDVAIGAVVPMLPFWHEHAKLEGHTGAVTCVAVAVDSRTVVSGGADATVRIWDLDHCRQIACLREHVATITCLAIDPQGKYAISGSEDGTVRVWDIEEEQMLLCCNHGGAVTGVAIQPDKGLAISAGKDGIVRLWNLASVIGNRPFWSFLQRKELRQFVAEHGAVTSLTVSLDGRHLITGNADATVCLWSLELPKQPAITFQGHEGPITRVALSADEKWLVSTSDSERNNLFIWDLKKQQKLVSFPGAKHGIHSLTIAANAYWILVSADDGVIHVWDLKWQKRKVAMLQSHVGAIQDLAANLSGSLAVSAGEDGGIRVWHNSFAWPLIREQKYLKVVPQGV